MKTIRMRSYYLIAAIAAAGLIFGTSRARADGWPRQEGVDAQHYVFRIGITEGSEELTGEATAEILFTKEGVGGFFLDLATPTANGHGMHVMEVTSDGKPVKYVHEENKLRITLPAPSKAGQKFTVMVKYHGAAAAGLHFGDNKYGVPVLFSENWPNRAHEWLPCIDHPSDKATSEMIVTAPEKYQVISNGLLVEDVDKKDGTHLYHWKESVPIATWLNAIGVAPFAVHKGEPVRGVPLQTWVYPEDAAALDGPVEDAARKAIDFYSDFVGPYAYEKMANVEAYGIGGGTEHATAIFYGERNLTPQSASLIAHETAHHWFGDCVTEKDWNDVWLSEGFATYFALLYTEKYQGREAFIAGVKRSQMGILRATAQLPVIHENVTDPRRILNNTFVYQKGACTLHMLRGIMGTEKFQAGLRDYYVTFFNGNASTDDLRGKMETAAGMKLDWFFDQWLKRAGNPNVQGTWHYDAAGKKVVIELAQTQEAEVYRLPLEVGITMEGAAGPMIEKIEMKNRKQTFEIAAEKEPSGVMLDPNAWVLMLSTLTKQ